jgi:anti-sigma factor RsiW
VNAERTPTDETQEDFPADLVAYLDGELDAQQTQAVEDRLSSDAVYRQQLRELQQTWDLLDQLPKADVDETFTRTTLSMVAVSVSGDAAWVNCAAGRWMWTGRQRPWRFAAGYSPWTVSRENRRLRAICR